MASELLLGNSAVSKPVTCGPHVAKWVRALGRGPGVAAVSLWLAALLGTCRC